MAKRRLNYEGSIYKRKNGKYRAQITLQGNRLSFTGNTQQDCISWIRKMQFQVERGLTYEGSKIRLSDFLKDWLVSKESSVILKTLNHYRRDVNLQIIPNLGAVKVSELKAIQIQRLYDQKQREGMGNRSVRHLHSTLRQALNHAVRLGLISTNPALLTTPPKKQEKEIVVLDESQIQNLLLAAMEYQPDIYALYYLAINTGMRQSELLGLQWSDVDWQSKSISVQRQVQFAKGRGVVLRGLKTKSSRRIIQLGDQMLRILKDHRIYQADRSFLIGDKWKEHDMIFPTSLGTPSYSSNLQKKFRRLLIWSKMKHIRFHDLRHTAATLMLKHKIPVIVVSRRLGHAQPSITLDIYGHLLPGMQEEAAQLMDEIMIPIALEIAPKLPQKPIKKEPLDKRGSKS
jgi:integrase